MSAEETSTAAPAQDERILAALAHVTVILPLFGIVAAIVVWTTQKDRSHFVAFQALQAVVFQLVMILAWFAGMGCYVCTYAGMIAALAADPLAGLPTGAVSDPSLWLVLVPFIVFGLISLSGFAFVLYGLVGAVQVLRGKAFRYVIIAPRLERYLQREARPEG